MATKWPFAGETRSYDTAAPHPSGGWSPAVKGCGGLGRPRDLSGDRPPPSENRPPEAARRATPFSPNYWPLVGHQIGTGWIWDWGSPDRFT